MSTEPGHFGISTRTVKAVDFQANPGDPVAPPVVPAATFHLIEPGSDELDTYGRASNPSWRQLESALATLEGASAALVFGSGMAAVTAALRALTSPGSVLVVPADGYYQVRAYASEYLAPQGVTVRLARTDEMCDAAAGADAVLAETPANPGLDVTDLHRLALICRGRGAQLIVDNTAATPLGQQPLSLGADLVVASATKALSGHSDLLAGYVAGSRPELLAALARERFGGLVSVELADAAAVAELVRRSELLVASTSFGGIHTTVDRRARWGDAVSAGFARLSMGIEDADDLIADFEQALA